jgi:hypothetical protein
LTEFYEVHCAGVPGNITILLPFLTEALRALNGAVVVWGYATFYTFQQEVMALEEQVLTGMALYWWVVFVLWATRRGWD